MAWTLIDKKNSSLRALVGGLERGPDDKVLGSGGWVGILEGEEGEEVVVSCTYTLAFIHGEDIIMPSVEFHSIWVNDKRGDDELLFEAGLVDRVLDRIFALEAAVHGHPDAERAVRLQALRWSLVDESVKQILGSD